MDPWRLAHLIGRQPRSNSPQTTTSFSHAETAQTSARWHYLLLVPSTPPFVLFLRTLTVADVSPLRPPPVCLGCAANPTLRSLLLRGLPPCRSCSSVAGRPRMPSPEMSAAHLSEGQHGQSVGDHLVNSSETAASSSFASSPDERVGPAHLGRHGLAPASLTTYTPLDTCLAQPFPLPTTTNADLLETPYDQRPDFSIDFAASVLPLADVSLPSPPIVRNIHKLRLPSFDVLGIANPRPDRIPLAANNSFTNSFSPIGAGPLSNPEDPLHALSPKLGRPQQLPGEEQFLEPDRYEFEPLSSSPEAARAHVERQVPTWTPPSEPGTINWGTFVRVRGVGSPPCSPSDGLDSTANSSSAANGNPSTAPAPTTTISVAELGDSLGMALWVNRVKEIISKCPSCYPSI